MLDEGSIPSRSTINILQVREQRRKVFVDLATWNDSLLFALQYVYDGPDQVSTAWDNEKGNTVMQKPLD